MKKTRISHIGIYLDFKSDESYTPKKFSIRGGLNMNDLKEICNEDLKDPVDWYIFPLKAKTSDGTTM